jgi:hypothetical protein
MKFIFFQIDLAQILIQEKRYYPVLHIYYYCSMEFLII